MCFLLCTFSSCKMSGDGADSCGSGILTRKDKSIDRYLFGVLEEIRAELDEEISGEEEHSEEYQKLFEERASERLNGESIMLGNKLCSVLKNYLDTYYTAKTVASLGRIQLPKKDLRSFSLDYGECFRAWVLSPHVTYEATNKIALGNLSLRDCFILHVWSFLVCYRSRGDNMFSLSICGKSSVGKSVVFENVFFENGFNFNGEAGVGRYDAKSRSILVYHDINIRLLASGKTDADKFKTISRSEKTSAKVHSSVKAVPPLFVVVTSNMRIHSHPARSHPKNFLLGEACPSELTVGSGKSKTSHTESIEAVKNRVLEAYCSERPHIDAKFFPTSGCFQRKNFILGVYGFVLDTVEKYSRTDFYSEAFVAYILTGLSENASFYCKVMEDGKERMAQLDRVLRGVCNNDLEYAKYSLLIPDQEERDDSPPVQQRETTAEVAAASAVRSPRRRRKSSRSSKSSGSRRSSSSSSSSSDSEDQSVQTSPASKRPLLE